MLRHRYKIEFICAGQGPTNYRVDTLEEANREVGAQGGVLREEHAMAAAERILALVNSSPRTPSAAELRDAIGYVRVVDTLEGLV